MGGVKGKSGPPGNLNNCKRPWRAFWRRRALKKEDRWILPTLEGYATGLASDKPSLTQAEMRVIEIGQIARGATMLILAEAARSGLIKKADDSWDLSPGAKDLARFLNIERAALQCLGLERRAQEVLSLTEYLNATKHTNEEATPHKQEKQTNHSHPKEDQT